MTVWMAGIFIKTSVFYYCAALGLAQVLNLKEVRPVIFPLGIILCTLSIPRRIFLTHNDLVIVGKELAKRGLLPVLDFMVRNPDLRLSAYMLVAAETGWGILHTTARKENSITEEIHGLLEQAEETSETQPEPIFISCAK